jgi:GalNAc5-diNAcBac-PP-undecaprenol beta-1,3-glucosyltransferase
VLNQAYSNFEIIVVDDGSTDNTEDKVRELTLRNKNLYYYKIENSERGYARNYGIKKSNSNYIVFLDSDDSFSDNYLSALANIIIQYPGYLIYAPKYALVRECGNQKILPNIPSGIYSWNDLLSGNLFACNICIENSSALTLFEVERKYSSMEDWLFLLANTNVTNIFHFDFVGVKMISHDGRSMMNNRFIINQFKNAVNYIFHKYSLSSVQKKILLSTKYRFISIHMYLNHEKYNSIKYLFKKILLLPSLKKDLILLLKYLFGYRLIGRLRSIL